MNEIKYLHLFPMSHFSNDYIRFVQKCYDTSEHYFILIKLFDDKVTNSLKKINLENVIIATEMGVDDSLAILNLMKSAEKVIIHGFHNSNVLEYYLSNLDEILQKTSIIVWNMYPTDILKLQDQYRNKIMNRCNKIFCLASKDSEFIEQRIDKKVESELIEYIIPGTMDLVNNYTHKQRERLTILLGNSSARWTNHEKILKQLAKYKNENIQIICPLSYGGNKNDIDKIIKLGKEIFSEKFIPMTKIISPKYYINVLKKVDVGIFDVEYQQAIGNIFTLAYLGKTIYLTEGSVNWRCFVEEQGFIFKDVNELENKTFDEFSQLNNYESIQNALKADYRFNLIELKNNWDKIFTQHGD